MNNAWCYFVLPFFPLSLSLTIINIINRWCTCASDFRFPIVALFSSMCCCLSGLRIFHVPHKTFTEVLRKMKDVSKRKNKTNKKQKQANALHHLICTISPSHWKRKWNIISSQTNALQSISISWMQRFPSLFYTIYSQWLASSIEKILFSDFIYRCLNPTHNICIEMLGWDIQQQRPTKRLEWKMER